MAVTVQNDSGPTVRMHANRAADYAVVKQQLAHVHHDDRHRYTEAKVPIIWELVHCAGDWAQQTGWVPGRSDV